MIQIYMPFAAPEMFKKFQMGDIHLLDSIEKTYGRASA